MQQYDSIIVGGGHNGLVCAAYLARAGQKVLLLEAAGNFGGLAGTREFHPGFKVSVAHSVINFSPKIVRELELEKYGYSSAGESIPLVGLGADGQHVTVADGQVSGVSESDQSSYRSYIGLLQRCATALAPSWLKTMPRVGNNSLKELFTFAQVGLKLRMLGKDDMLEFFRIASLPARDIMDENFDNDLLKAALSWDALIGSRQAPRSPNNTMLTVMYRMTGDHTDGSHGFPSGGVERLIAALVESAESFGVELRRDAAVSEIMLDASEAGLQATGVKLADGSSVTASRVISAADPKRTFLDLVGARNLEIEFTNRIQRLRTDGMVAKLHLALSGAPSFTGIDKPNGRMIISPEMDAIEFAFDDAKYGQYPRNPVMEVFVPSLRDNSMAPAGQHVLSANVMYVPFDLKGGWTETARLALQEQLLKTLEAYAPGIRDLVVGVQLLTPEDLQRDWNVTGGHWHHTEMAMDQMLMMRPTYEAAQYSTPIPGLYLCGAGCHPGGDVSGAAGHNAAQEILR